MKRLRKLFGRVFSRRGLRWIVALVTLLAIVWQIENWRGRSRWAAVRQELLDDGYSLDWRDYYPAPPAEEENAALHPAFAGLCRLRDDGSKTISFRPFYDRLEGIPRERPAEQGDVEFLEATEEMGVLAGEWEQAFSRQHCVWFPFDVRTSEGIPPVPTMGNLTAFVSKYAPLYQQRALSHLRLGDPEAARREWLSALRFFHCMREEPSIVGLLVDIALVSIALPGCEEVMAAGGWRVEDLAELQEVFGAMKFMRRVDSGVHLILVADLHTIEAMMNNESWAWEEVQISRWTRLFPRGWWYQNMVWVAEYMQRNAFDWYDAPRQVLAQGDIDSIRSPEESKRDRYHPYRFISYIAPTVGNIAGAGAANQSRAELLELACALRRYHFATGSYPERLEELVPMFIDELPVDRRTGDALKYTRGASDVVLVGLGGEVEIRLPSR